VTDQESTPEDKIVTMAEGAKGMLKNHDPVAVARWLTRAEGHVREVRIRIRRGKSENEVGSVGEASSMMGRSAIV
jgi:hypothetical protein